MCDTPVRSKGKREFGLERPKLQRAGEMAICLTAKGYGDLDGVGDEEPPSCSGPPAKLVTTAR